MKACSNTKTSGRRLKDLLTMKQSLLWSIRFFLPLCPSLMSRPLLRNPAKPDPAAATSSHALTHEHIDPVSSAYMKLGDTPLQAI